MQNRKHFALENTSNCDIQPYHISSPTIVIGGLVNSHLAAWLRLHELVRLQSLMTFFMWSTDQFDTSNNSLFRVEWSRGCITCHNHLKLFLYMYAYDKAYCFSLRAFDLSVGQDISGRSLVGRSPQWAFHLRLLTYAAPSVRLLHLGWT